MAQRDRILNDMGNIKNNIKKVKKWFGFFY
jgi:hypothetical protein